MVHGRFLAAIAPLLLCFASTAAIISTTPDPVIAADAARSGGDACNNPPAHVTAAIQPGWVLLRLGDLNPDDRRFWITARPQVCPGYAAAIMEKGSQPAYAVATLRRRADRIEEQVVLIVPKRADVVVHQLAMPRTVGNPAVVWRVAPGKTRAWDGSRTMNIRYDSVVVETIESAAEQFYFAGGRLKSIVTSN